MSGRQTSILRIAVIFLGFLALCGCRARRLPPPKGIGWQIYQQRFLHTSSSSQTYIHNAPGGAIVGTTSVNRSQRRTDLDLGTPMRSTCLPGMTNAATVGDADWSKPLEFLSVEEREVQQSTSFDINGIPVK